MKWIDIDIFIIIVKILPPHSFVAWINPQFGRQTKSFLLFLLASAMSIDLATDFIYCDFPEKKKESEMRHGFRDKLIYEFC